MVSSTRRAWLVRPSKSVGSTPQTSSARLVKRRTSWTVSRSWPTPRWGERLALQRDEDPVCCGEGGHGEDTERGRAVEEHPVVVLPVCSRSSSAVLMTCSRPVRVNRSASARASSIVAGSISTPSWVSSRTSRASRPFVRTWWTESSRSSGSMPKENVRQACGSRSTNNTRCPSSASAAPREATVVVLATPPFWLAIASVVPVVGSIMPDAVAIAHGHLNAGHMTSSSTLPSGLHSSPVPRPALDTSSPSSWPDAAIPWCWSPVTRRAWRQSPSGSVDHRARGGGTACRPGGSGSTGSGRGAPASDRERRSRCWSTTQASASTTLPRQRRGGRAADARHLGAPVACLGDDDRARQGCRRQRLQHRIVPAAQRPPAEPG